MNQFNVSFESENLHVDWISFKFPKCDEVTEREITHYLFIAGFNSYRESEKLSKPIKERIRVNSTNIYQVILVKEFEYWQGTTINFSGDNARVFYFLIQKNLVPWNLFSSGILNRFDLCYYRKNQKDKLSRQEFLINCQNHLKETHRNVIFEKKNRGGILKIGNRRSNLYSRIYEKKNSLKFEHEMKGKFLRNYHRLLVSNELKEFENQLTFHFWIYFGKLLPLEFSYMDWLLVKLRPIRKQSHLSLALNSDYVTSEFIADPEDFILLIQFLTYAKNLDFKTEYLGGIGYREVIFQLRDFLQFQNPTIQARNNYQLRKMKDFFDRLQKGCLITSFTNRYFQSLVAVPQVKFEKCSKQKSLIGKVCLMEDLFYYQYPFFIPNLFQGKLQKYQIKVRLTFLQAFSSVNIKKIIMVQEFFENYGSSLSHQDQTKIRKEFIKMVKDFQELRLIENRYEIFRDGSIFSAPELTTRNISEGFVIFEVLELNSGLIDNILNRNTSKILPFMVKNSSIHG